MPYVLPTDALVWLLVAVAVAYGFYCRGHPHLAVPWSRVFQSPAAMASSVVLCAYLAIGLADSLHFRPQLEQKAGDKAAYSTEILSLLDTGLAQLRGRGEKTYSAPLATRSYAKEQIELPDGRQMRDFPRLRFGDLSQHTALLIEARGHAERILDEDPGLVRPEHEGLRRSVARRFAQSVYGSEGG